MNLKTEAQYRQELANAWQLIDAERSATRLMREKLQAANSAAHSLAAQLCAVAEVAEKDGYTLIRRESVMVLVTRWRTQWDAAMKVPNARVEGRDAASSRRVHSHDGLCVAVDTEKEHEPIL